MKKAKKKVTKELNFYFNGKDLKLTVHRDGSGFSLWDENTGKWIIDASTINQKNENVFWVSSGKPQKAKTFVGKAYAFNLNNRD